MSYPFAINHYIWPKDRPVLEFLDLAVRLGAGEVALTRRALEELSPEHLCREIRARELSVSSLNSAGFLTDADPDKRARHADENRRLIEAAALLDARALCVITGGAETLERLETARAHMRDGLAALDAEAAAAGVSLGLEPIHPAECLAKGVCNSIAQALQLTRDLTATRLIVDLYHSCWDPDLARYLAGTTAHPVVLQVCDPVTRAGHMHRDVPTSEWAKARISDAQKSGFQGPIEVELFERDLFGRDPEALLASLDPADPASRV